MTVKNNKNKKYLIRSSLYNENAKFQIRYPIFNITLKNYIFNDYALLIMTMNYFTLTCRTALI